MRIKIKLTGALHAEIIRDLARPHPFAAERVGFVSGRMGTLADNGRLVLLTRYHSIPDDQYLDDPSVGARIGSEAITWAILAASYTTPHRRKGAGPAGTAGSSAAAGNDALAAARVAADEEDPRRETFAGRPWRPCESLGSICILLASDRELRSGRQPARLDMPIRICLYRPLR